MASGAATGAAIGSVVPGVGTAVGGLFGGIADVATSLFNPAAKEKAARKKKISKQADRALAALKSGSRSAIDASAKEMANLLSDRKGGYSAKQKDLLRPYYKAVVDAQRAFKKADDAANLASVRPSEPAVPIREIKPDGPTLASQIPVQAQPRSALPVAATLALLVLR